MQKVGLSYLAYSNLFIEIFYYKTKSYYMSD